MNLKKQIGQLMVVGYQGLNPSRDFLKFVEEWGIGGFIFFVRNLGEPEELKKVVQTLEDASGGPIFTAIDQEGGLVLRILKDGSLFPGAMGLAATGRPDLIRSVSKAIGLEMRALGLNWNLAPVLDINHPENPGIGARSFGDTPEQVARYGKEAIAGFQEAGILACAKHFPGKGHAMVDSHLSLPVIPYDEARLFSFELFPFIEAMKAGVDSVMTSHVYFPAFEPTPNLPGTLSRKVLIDLLRGKLGYEGLLVTDDMEMGAITEAYGVPEATKRAFLAGSDLLLICHDLERQKQAAEALLSEVVISQEARDRLTESLDRIAPARRKISAAPSKKTLKEWSHDHQGVVTEAYEKAVLVHRQAPGRLPLAGDRRKVFLCPEVSALVQVEETQQGDGLAQMIREKYGDAICPLFHPKAAAWEILDSFEEKLETLTGPVDLVILGYNAHLFAGQRDAFNALVEKYPDLVLVAIRNPYDVTAVPKAATALASFGFRSPAIRALLRVLSGEGSAGTASWPVQV